VRAGCIVVLCDVYVDEEKTPKTHETLRNLALDQPWCYVLPLVEQKSVDDAEVGKHCKLIEDAAVMLVEYVAKRPVYVDKLTMNIRFAPTT
jgi:hypothetical protein